MGTKSRYEKGSLGPNMGFFWLEKEILNVNNA